MNTHLSDDVLLELVETGKTHPHLDGCDRCRRLFEEAQEALTLVRAEEVPEPSPLFWDHFSARVSEAIDAEAPAMRASRWTKLLTPAWRPAVAVTMVLVIVAAVTWRTGFVGGRRNDRAAATQHGVAREAATASAHGDNQAVADLLAPPSDASWSIIDHVTSGLELTKAADAGIVVQPGTSERAISQLTPAEQQELLRLLQSELDDPSL